MTLPEHLQKALERGRTQNRPVAQGQVQSLLGSAIQVKGLRAAVGELCTIHSSSGDVQAEVVGFQLDYAILMPLGGQLGIAPLDLVTARGRPLSVVTGDALLGRVIDSLGRPIDGGPPITGIERPVTSDAPPALQRRAIDTPLETGVSSIDGFLTVGKGQRIGIFAGSGVGKSTLMGMIAKGCSSDVNVIALIGERGREVKDFIDDVLGPEGMARSVVVVETSDSAPMLRYKGPFTAVTVAESFRDQGHDVLFMMDSVTRFAGASREIGLAAGEPPTLRGYPPSLFAQLPRLVERLGNSHKGSITGMITVLVDGDDFNEPVSDALRGYLDGHIVLDRAIAARGRFPAVDVLASISRLMPKVTTDDQQLWASKVRELLAHYEEFRDLVQVGAYRQGTDPLLDRAIARLPGIEDLMYQGTGTRSFDETVRLLATLGT